MSDLDRRWRRLVDAARKTPPTEPPPLSAASVERWHVAASPHGQRRPCAARLAHRSAGPGRPWSPSPPPERWPSSGPIQPCSSRPRSLTRGLAELPGPAPRGSGHADTLPPSACARGAGPPPRRPRTSRGARTSTFPRGHSMRTPDLLFWLLLITGTYLALVAYWLAAVALFAPAVERARLTYATRPVGSTVLGLVLFLPLLALGKVAPGPLKLVGAVVLGAPVAPGPDRIGGSGRQDRRRPSHAQRHGTAMAARPPWRNGAGSALRHSRARLVRDAAPDPGQRAGDLHPLPLDHPAALGRRAGDRRNDPALIGPVAHARASGVDRWRRAQTGPSGYPPASSAARTIVSRSAAGSNG